MIQKIVKIAGQFVGRTVAASAVSFERFQRDQVEIAAQLAYEILGFGGTEPRGLRGGVALGGGFI